jgi:hypothetical protein
MIFRILPVMLVSLRLVIQFSCYPVLRSGAASSQTVGQNGHQMIASSVSNLFGATGQRCINSGVAGGSLHFQELDPTTSFTNRHVAR